MTARDRAASVTPTPTAPPPTAPLRASQRTRVVEALARSEERFHLLVDAVADYAIFMLNPQGIVASWNTGAQRIKGYTEQEIIGQHFSRFYTPEDRASGKPARVLAEARQNGRYEEEGWRVRKDGTRFWASVVLTALRDDKGQLLGFGKVTRDLTERRQAEEDRRQRLVAESVAQMRGEFLSVAAHELKTPVTALRGRAQLTLRRFRRSGELSPERVREALEVIDNQAGKIARLVEQLLDVSRLEAGHLMVDRQESNLAAVITSVVAMFRSRDDGDRVRLELPRSTVLAWLDSLRIEQVLTNLIENALKYSPPESPVQVSIDEIRPSAPEDANGRRVRVTVADQGPGVPIEDRPHLFDRFFRSRATTHTSGMGLGLYVSRQIVELHGGAICAEFPSSGGTRMVMELPADQPAAEPAGAPAAAV